MRNDPKLPSAQLGMVYGGICIQHGGIIESGRIREEELGGEGVDLNHSV